MRGRAGSKTVTRKGESDDKRSLENRRSMMMMMVAAELLQAMKVDMSYARAGLTTWKLKVASPRTAKMKTMRHYKLAAVVDTKQVDDLQMRRAVVRSLKIELELSLGVKQTDQTPHVIACEV